jgi:CRP-like cAMP-binding protein
LALDDDIARLAAAPVFGLLGRDALRLLSFAADHRALARGAVLFRRGDPSDGGYVVLEGRIALVGTGEATTLAGPAALIGRSALFTPAPRPATATAQETSTLLRVTPALMRRVLEEFPEARQAVRRALADDLVDLGTGLERIRRRLDAIRDGDGGITGSQDDGIG